MQDRIELENAYSNFCMRNAGDDEYLRWQGLGSSHRLQVHKNKQLVVYTWFMGRPSEKLRLTLTNFTLTPDKGVASFWVDQDGRSITIPARPTEIFPSCFIWHPKFTQVSLVDAGGGFSAMVSLLWKTTTNPRNRLEGVGYLADAKTFNVLCDEHTLGYA